AWPRSRSRPRPPSSRHVPIAEDPLDLVPDRPLLVDELVRDRAGPLEQIPVTAQAGELEPEEAGLARPGEVALAAQLEVALGELEPVVRFDQRFQSLLRGLRQLVLRPGDEQGV